MGRNGRYGHTTVGKVHLVRVYLDSGGYDNGGAYWGLGEPLYHAYDDSLSSDHEEGRGVYAFVRATSREKAKQELNIPNAVYYR